MNTDDYPFWSKKRAAYHEAAHTVLDVVLNLPRGRVTVDTGDPETGYAVGGNPLTEWKRGDGRRRPLIEAHCVSLYAGAEAERLFLGDTAGGEWRDNETVRDRLSYVSVRGAAFVGDDVWQRYENRLKGRAANLVRKYQEDIKRVASELMKRGTLEYEEINAILAHLIS